ncbi:GNAT superfamily N-acetyltransferase [Paenibacillus sp. DS2015]|uniref:GNAT family N-acetyltransferase n=1 Tax=Paenibacillus sp. DS2015 TaxID=3373917 RepID=UPI003D242D31
MIQIRQYRSSDVKELASLMGDLGYPTSSDDMNRRMDKIDSIPCYKTFVAVINNKVVGMIGLNIIMSYESDDVVTHILALVTKTDFQGRGIGRDLMKFVEDWALSNGSHTLYLTSGIKDERKRAHEFYKQLGFEITGYRFIKK